MRSSDIFLLDTSVIVDAINGRRGRTAYLDSLLDQGGILACCAINVTETYAGLRSHEAMATEEFLRCLKFYEITWDVARLAGDLKRTWARRGITLGLPDLTIAAVALVHGITLATDNRKDFPMPELLLAELPTN
jgi:predicted nucleic acid-binding protein